MRLDDDLLESRNRGGHGVVVLLRHRARIEEAAGVVQLDLRDRPAVSLRSRSRAAATCAGIAPGGVSAVVVYRHRSHITQRHGHSRPVRKTVARPRHAPIRRALVLDDHVLVAPGIVLGRGRAGGRGRTGPGPRSMWGRGPPSRPVGFA